MLVVVLGDYLAGLRLWLALVVPHHPTTGARRAAVEAEVGELRAALEVAEALYYSCNLNYSCTNLNYYPSITFSTVEASITKVTCYQRSSPFT
eukprot:SAG31_NODE_2595_length_5421_cov_2.387636_8_plen_93_part_00